MEKPVTTENNIFVPSSDLVDEILNGIPFGRYGNAFRDYKNQKYIHYPQYLGGNNFGFYVVAAESDDLCRIAFERGDLNGIDFWSRFGFVWRLHPSSSGILQAEKIPMTQVDSTTRCWWEFHELPPIKLAEKRFKDVLTSSDADPVHQSNIRKFRVRYLEALAIRKRQWQEIDGHQKSA
jgi:hypothetical protein